MSQKGARQVRDKWRAKAWYTILSPNYFGSVELSQVPADDPSKLMGRIIDSTLYDITNDFQHQYLKMYFQVVEVDEKSAKTVFKGHEYSRDYLRSLVRRRTTRVDSLINVTTKDGYKLRLSASVFTLSRIKTSQENSMRKLMMRITKEKSEALTFDQFVQEIVLGKIASDIYNEAKKIAPIRHVGIRKSKLIQQPAPTAG
jgi:small subunit ribosomal protein S3Ae